MSPRVTLNAGAVLTLGLAVQTACQGAPCEEPSCPASFAQIVIAAADGGAVQGVQATLSGPMTVTLSCSPQTGGAGTLCGWPGSDTPGSYSLQVTAPGFQAAKVKATVTYSPAPACGCPETTMQPSTLTLDPL